MNINETKELLYDSVKDIDYGSITIHIQDGKIVYIEKTEKIKVKESESKR